MTSFHRAFTGILAPYDPLSPYLEVTEQVLEGGGVGNDGGLVATVNCSHQREGEMEDVAVEQRALLLQQHCQQLQEADNSTNTQIIVFHCFLTRK